MNGVELIKSIMAADPWTCYSLADDDMWVKNLKWDW